MILCFRKSFLNWIYCLMTKLQEIIHLSMMCLVEHLWQIIYVISPPPKVSFAVEEQEFPKMDSMMISFQVTIFQGVKQYNLCLVFYQANGMWSTIHQEYEALCSPCVYHWIVLNVIWVFLGTNFGCCVIVRF